VLIPHGEVEITAYAPHVSAVIQLAALDSLSFSHFRLDNRLGRLISDDLDSHLFRVYLHSITSFPEADRFTGRTGSEEALFGLSDSISRTSLPFSPRAQGILKLIASLSPTRKFYPPHLKTMQTAKYHPILPVLSQRDLFFGTVSDIFSHNLKAAFLFDNDSVVQPSYQGDFVLLTRAHHRSRKLFAVESVASIIEPAEDAPYIARDGCISAEQASAFSISSLVRAWPSQFKVAAGLTELIKGWKVISGFDEEYVLTSLSDVLTQAINERWASLLSGCRSDMFSATGL
jgi:hypothetical protein